MITFPSPNLFPTPSRSFNHSSDLNYQLSILVLRTRLLDPPRPVPFKPTPLNQVEFVPVRASTPTPNLDMLYQTSIL